VPAEKLTYLDIRNIFESDIKACDISRFDLFDSNENEKELNKNTSIELLNATNANYASIKINTTAGFRIKIYAFSYVKNLIAPEGLMFDICVCGWEKLLSLKPDPIEIILFKTNDGTKVTLK
jgi:hypothetical protein